MMHFCFICKRTLAKGEGYFPRRGDSICRSIAALVSLTDPKVKKALEKGRADKIGIEGVLCESCLKHYCEEIIEVDKMYLCDKQEARRRASMLK